MRDYPIGTILRVIDILNGHDYFVIVSLGWACRYCIFFSNKSICSCDRQLACSTRERHDKSSVFFKKLNSIIL